MKVCLGIVLLFLFAYQGETAKNDNNRCKRVKHFRKNRSYLYEYGGIVENEIKGTSEKSAKMRISAKLLIDYITDCEYSLQLKDVKLEESFGDGFSLSPRNAEAAETLQRFPLQFVMEYGLITELRPALKERQKDILNIKRGILSSLQVKWAKNKESFETTVSGACDVKYHVIKHIDGTKNITKTTDLSSCRERTMAHSNIESEQYIKASSIYDAKSSCKYLHKKKHEILRAECEEYYLVKPFSSSSGAGSYTKISQTFILLKSKKVSKGPRNFPEFYSTSLLFDHKHEEKSKSPDSTSAEEILIEIAMKSLRSVQPGSANRFAELVFSLRTINERGLGNILGKLSTCFGSPSCSHELVEASWSYIFEALAQCGSTPCVNILANLIMTNKVPVDRTDDLISSLNFIQEPSTAMLNTVMGIHKVTSNPHSLLLLGTLMHKLCKHRSDECLGNGPIANVVKNAEFYLMRLLGNECSTKDLKKGKEMYYALKAIGNAGRPIRIKNIILDCVQHAAHLNTSIAALHALKRMPLDDKVKDFLRVMLTDRNADIEKRMESFMMLMSGPSKEDILLAVDMVNDPEETRQLRSFISSFLNSVVMNQAPERKRLTTFFRRTLALKNMTSFNPTATRYSKMFEKSAFLDIAGIGGSVNSKILFHPESFIPRTFRLGINAQALGHAVDFMEINARMEGIEREMGRFFNEQGLMSKDFIKNAFNIPNFEPEDKVKERNRRDVVDDLYEAKLKNLDKEVNLKEPTPQLALSMKIFGNEVRMFSLEDIPFLNGDMDNFNIIHALYSLTKGRRKTLRRSVLFMEGRYVVPTIIGLPLSFEMNGSAVVSVNLEGKVAAKNLIFGPKLLTLKGSFLPSISTEISGKVTVDGVFSKAGMRFNARTHASAMISGEIKYEEGKEFKVNIDAPQEPVDLFSYNHEIFHVVGSEEIRISGSKRRTKLNVCADELYKSTRIFGVDVCSEMSFPVAYHNLDAPYYPLTGPANVAFTLKKTDASLSQYHLSILKNNDLYRVKFGTPGAQNERWTVLNLGITASSQRGVIGATFGDSNRGLMLRYQYDNKTHSTQATIVSNITQNELTISAKYFNETVPATLDLKMGFELVILGQNVGVNSKFYFVDTYEYWGFNWLVDYGREPIIADLKVAYNPQTVFFKFQYGEKNFAVQLQPNFPVVILDIGINWRPAILNLTLNVDLKYHSVVASANTTAHSYGSSIAWIKGYKRHEMMVKFNRDEEMYKWITSINFEKKDKIFESYLAGSQRKYGAMLILGDSKITGTLHGFPAQLQAVLTRDGNSRGLVLTGFVGKHSAMVNLNYKRKPEIGLHAMCIAAKSGASHADLCFDVVLKAGEKSLQLKLDSSGGKFSTSMVFKPPKSSWIKVIGKPEQEHIAIKTVVNERTVFEATARTDKSSRFPSKRTLSLVTIKAGMKNIHIDFKLPLRAMKNGKPDASGWFIFRRDLKDGEQTFEIRRNSHVVLNSIKKDIKTTTEYKYKKRIKQDVLLFVHTETETRNLGIGNYSMIRETIYSSKSLMLHNKEIFDGTSVSYKWKGSYKYSKISAQNMVPTSPQMVEYQMMPVRPFLYLSVEVEKMLKDKMKYYPKTIFVDVLGNKVSFNIDLKKRVSNLNASLKSGSNATISVRFAKKDEFVLLADYRNATWDMKTLTVTIAKDAGRGSWQIRIHHPVLKILIGNLRRKYWNERQKLKMEVLKKITGILSKNNETNQARDALLADVSLAFGMDYLKANLSQLLANASLKWADLVKAVVQGRLNKAVKRGFENTVRTILNGSLQSSPAIKEIGEELSADLSNFVVDVLSMKTASAMKVGKEIGYKFKKHLTEFVNGPAFKRIANTAFRKTLEKQNMPKETRGKLIKIFDDGLASVLQNPRNVVRFYKTFSEAVMKVGLQEQGRVMKIGLTRMLAFLRAHLAKSADSKLRSDLYALIDKVEKVMIDIQYDNKHFLSQTVRKLMDAFKKSGISGDGLRKMAFEIINSKLSKAGIPEKIRLALVQLTKELNYADFYYNIMGYCLQTLKLTDPMYTGLAAKLYKNDVKGLIETAGLAVSDKRLPVEVKSVFEKYLQSFNTFDLVSGLANTGLRKFSNSTKLADALGRHLSSRNLTGFAREVMQFGLSKLRLPKEAKVVFQELIVGRINKDSLQSVVKLIDKAFNSSNDWSNVLLSLHASDNMAMFVKKFYIEAIKQLKLAPAAKDLFIRFAHNLNVSDLLKKVDFIAITHVFKAIKISQGNNTFSLAKMAFLNYLKQGANLVPDLWKPRLGPIFKVLIQEVKQTRPADVIKNSTKVLFQIGEKVFMEVNKYVSSSFSADLEKDLKEVAKTMMGKITLGNVPVAHLMMQMKRLFKDRVMFGLRLASQIFPDQVKEFSKKYATKHGFDYQKLYSNFLQTNFSSGKFTKKIESSFESLGKRILMEVTNATGGFSTGTGFLNMLKFVRGLNFTDANSVITSYEKMQKMKYTKWSLPVLLQHLKVALKRIGQWNVGKQTIDKHVAPMIRGFRTVLPRIIAANENFEKITEKFFGDALIRINGTKIEFSRLMEKSLMTIRYSFGKWRKILTFASDMSVPLLSNIPRIFASNRAAKEQLSSEYMKLKDLMSKVGASGLFEDLRKFIYKTNGIPVDKSLRGIMLKSSKAFNLIVQELVAKKLMFSRDILQEIQNEITKLLSTMNNFLSQKAGQPLYKLISKSGRHSFSYLKSSFTNSTLAKKIKQELMPLYNLTLWKKDMQTYFKNISQSMKKAFDQLDQKSVKKWAQAVVPGFVSNVTSESTKALIQALGFIDKTRGYLSVNPFFKNPLGYLRELPRRIMMMLAQRINIMRPRVMEWFVAVENMLRLKAYKARSVYEEYLKKTQDLVNKVSSKLDQLNHYSSLLKIINNNGWEKHLSNYTHVASEKLRESQRQLTAQLGKLGKSGSLENALTKVTMQSKELLRDLKSIFGKNLYNMTQSMNAAIVQLEKYEQQASSYDKIAAENVTRIFGQVEQLTKNTTEMLLSILQDASKKIEPGKDLILRKILSSLEVLQRNVTGIKQTAMQYVSMMDDSTLVFVVPRLSKNVKVVSAWVGKKIATKVQAEKGIAMGTQSMVSSSGSSSGEDYFSYAKQVGGVISAHSVPASAGQQVEMRMQPPIYVTAMQPGIQNVFDAIDKALIPVPSLFDNALRDFEASKKKLFERLDRDAALNWYVNFVLFPLEKLSVAASMPAPAESLKALGRSANVWERCSKMFMPSPGSATLYRDHLFTFDGNYVFIPKLARARKRCAYLLARDFHDGNFTVLYDLNRLTLKTKESSVLIDRNGEVVIVESLRDSVRRITELPAQVGTIIVKRFGPIVKVESAVGFVLQCNLKMFMCTFTVSGTYHNRTLGLFGTNNAEYADDFRLPDGNIAFDIVEFVRSWELSGDETCRSLNYQDLAPRCSRPASPRCNALFKAKSSSLARAFDNVNPVPYSLACEYETSRCRSSRRRPARHCPIVAAYVNMAMQNGLPIKHPDECGSCVGKYVRRLKLGGTEYHKDPSSVDLVLIIRDSKSIKKALRNLISVMQNVDVYLKSSSMNPRYWLVGFDGLGYRMAPYLQTGNSKVFGNIQNLVTALNNLQFKNTNKAVSGLEAIKFASQIEFRSASTRLFMVLDSVAVYSGALKEMMEANNMLRSKGIILNAINRYKFKRNIIGKDSFKKRYHLKIPRGERLRNLAFHTADDYMPIVKESRGAVMTMRALMSSNEKWMKAFPRSLNEILHSQIKFDKKHCKSCKCVMNREGYGVLKCQRADAC